MVGLIALGTPLVQILFEHGRFTPRATSLTASALAGYALGLPAYAAVKVLASAFYAMKDTKTPVKVANISMAVNIAGNLALMGPWGVGGLAFATAIASLVNAALLFWLLRRRLGLLGGRRLALSLARAGAASLVMGAAAWAWTRWGVGPLLLRVAVAVAGGAVLYFVLARLLRCEESDPLTGLFRRA
jgi:putative peptidoglycan lipid II flippase